MRASSQTFRFDWHGLSVSVEYCPEWSLAFKSSFGSPLAHLQIRREGGGPLPMTETGYRSHFTGTIAIEERGGPETFVRDWLDAAAAQPEWRKRRDAWEQPSLFT